MSKFWNAEDFLKAKPVRFQQPSKWAEITTSDEGFLVKVKHELQSSLHADEALKIDIQVRYRVPDDMLENDGSKVIGAAKKHFQKLFEERMKKFMGKLEDDCQKLEDATKSYLESIRTKKSNWEADQVQQLEDFVNSNREVGAKQIRKAYEDKLRRLMTKVAEEAVGLTIPKFKNKVEVAEKIVHALLIYGVVGLAIAALCIAAPPVGAAAIAGVVLTGVYLTAKQYDAYKKAKESFLALWNRYSDSLTVFQSKLTEAEKAIQTSLEALENLDRHGFALKAQHSRLKKELTTCKAELETGGSDRDGEDAGKRIKAIEEKMDQIQLMLDQGVDGYRIELEGALKLVQKQSLRNIPKRSTWFNRTQEFVKNGFDFMSKVAGVVEEL
ncbi:hypothetical protein [Rhizobium halophytocola]|uniref:Uncharacterized protein n=1 Tax=Rhizobium halophytocola TaxID=735519 RepID=A0ABS4DV34_9HYPH|nr:hypothetical protein [Rhizobium halophytocola]MBP1849546.1 hypothetical protein [Rhizobium halophytocola]